MTVMINTIQLSWCF